MLTYFLQSTSSLMFHSCLSVTPSYYSTLEAPLCLCFWRSAEHVSWIFNCCLDYLWAWLANIMWCTSASRYIALTGSWNLIHKNVILVYTGTACFKAEVAENVLRICLGPVYRPSFNLISFSFIIWFKPLFRFRKTLPDSFRLNAGH